MSTPTVARGVRRTPALAVCAVALGAITGCGSTGSTSPDPDGTGARAAALQRARTIESTVDRWADAASLAGAKAAAEQTRNLITGPRVPGSGDGDRDGRTVEVRVGLLPGADGSPGLTSSLTDPCIRQDVLGGSWKDPEARWDDVLRRIAAWTPTSNPFPELPSHAQRTVGWASLTLGATTLAEAREYAGHASGHAALVTAAIADPAASPCPGG